MGQVVVDIGGRSYPLSCRDGDEGHLIELAAGIADKANGLTRSLGSMSEPRLLLMVALMVADELDDVRRGKLPSWSPPRPADPDVVANHRLGALVARAEQLAARVDQPG